MESLTSAPAIELSHVSKHYGSMQALKDVSLAVQEGEFVVIVGASGCGKSTMLNMIAGFDRPTSGRIQVQGRENTGVNPECGMVFQQYALFPWMTVEDNIAFGLKMKRMSKAERRNRAQEYIDMVGLRGFEKSYPKALSGGMRQRVAIARVLANNPKVMLFDEPFAALDAMTRQVLQEQLVRIYEQQRKTIVFITHSIDEALLLSSRIIVMSARPGQVVQDINNDLPHPRNADVQLSERYLELKRHIWHAVQAEVVRSIEAAA
ncbi:ABC transporter ATP-binding protein [Microvirga makkahensis]|uniref:ATP-binding cassette domain-containing protein n=1 Tax=Microvirga makkahensis TaxID=1128670 RepID=A0A7X3MNW9_9HYPH|nr:ABC transporter ATP-binding protein [Microvirga makkahensis]MXQ10477.1 ATP-binding cassette domain-containing protein [Microvirga makkahensis]